MKKKQDSLIRFFFKKFVGTALLDGAPLMSTLFKAFRLQKYHVQDAWNGITCLRIKASKTLPMSLSQN